MFLLTSCITQATEFQPVILLLRHLTPAKISIFLNLKIATEHYPRKLFSD